MTTKDQKESQSFEATKAWNHGGGKTKRKIRTLKKFSDEKFG